MNAVKKSRATLIGVVLAFALPVIGAKFVLDQSWYEGAATNKGIMLSPPITLSEASNATLPEGWHVALIADQACAENCMQALYAMNQLDIALGKESDRVTPLLLSSSPVNMALDQVPMVQPLQNASLVRELAALPAHHLFIIDPMGNVMLHYPSYSDEATMRAKAKELLSDLRTLLKLSRMG